MSIKIDHYLESLSTESQILKISNTGAVLIPAGTTAQRPASPTNGMLRYNTSTNSLEAYVNNSWIDIATSGTALTTVSARGSGFVLIEKEGTQLVQKTLLASGGVEIVDTGTTITVSARRVEVAGSGVIDVRSVGIPGGVRFIVSARDTGFTQVSSVGTGAVLYTGTSSKEIIFKKITGSSDVQVIDAGNTIRVSANTGVINISAFSGTTSLVRTDTGKEVIFKGLSQGGAANIYDSGNNIVVSAPRTTVTGGGVIEVTYSNTGNNQYKVSAARVKLLAGTNVTITSASDGTNITYTINANDTAGFTSTSYTGVGQNIVKSTTASDIQFYGIGSGGDVNVRTAASAIIVSANTGLINAINAGGTSLIKSTSNKTLQLYGLVAGGDVQINVGASAIVVSANTGVVNISAFTGTVNLVRTDTGKEVVFRGLTQGGATNLYHSGNNIVVSSPRTTVVGGGTVEVTYSNTGGNNQYKVSAARVKLLAGTNVTITSASDGTNITYTINANDTAGFTTTSYTGLGQNIVKGTTATDIQFYGIAAGGDVNVRTAASAIVVSANTGITNAANAGGTSLIKSTSNKTLQLYGLAAGGDIQINTGASALVISANTGVINVSAFTGTVNIVRTDTGKEVIFRGFSQGGAANLRYSGNNIVVSAPRTTVTGGGTVEVTYSNTGGNNQYKVSAARVKLQAGSNVSITSSTDGTNITYTINASYIDTGFTHVSSVGTGAVLYTGTSSKEIVFKRITGGGDLQVVDAGNTIRVSANTGVVNVSAFTGTVNIVRTDDGKEVVFRGLSQGGAANLYNSGNNIVVSAPRTTVVGGGSVNVVYSNTGGNNQYRVSAARTSARSAGGTSIVKHNIGNIIELYGITAGGNINVRTAASAIVVSANTGLVNAVNAGGTTLIKSTSNKTLQLYGITPGGDINVRTAASAIVVSANTGLVNAINSGGTSLIKSTSNKTLQLYGLTAGGGVQVAVAGSSVRVSAARVKLQAGTNVSITSSTDGTNITYTINATDTNTGFTSTSYTGVGQNIVKNTTATNIQFYGIAGAGNVNVRTGTSAIYVSANTGVIVVSSFSGTANIVRTNTGKEVIFRGLSQGGAVNLYNSGNNIIVSAPRTTVVGGGSINVTYATAGGANQYRVSAARTSARSAGGTSLIKNNVGNVVELYGITAGGNVNVRTAASAIVVSANTGLINAINAGGTSLIKSTSNKTLQLYGLTAGGGVQVAVAGSSVRVSAARVKLQAGSNVSITSSTDGTNITYTINATDTQGFTSTTYTGIGQNIVKSTTSNTIQFYGIAAAGDINLRTAASAIYVSANTGVVSVSAFTGTVNIVRTDTGKEVIFRGFSQGGAANLRYSGNNIVVSAPRTTVVGGGSINVVYANTGGNNQYRVSAARTSARSAGGTSLVKNNVGNVIELYGITAGGNINVRTAASAIVVSANTGLVNAINAGGTSLIKSTSNKTLQLYGLTAGGGVQVAVAGSSVRVSAARVKLQAGSNVSITSSTDGTNVTYTINATNTTGFTSTTYTGVGQNIVKSTTSNTIQFYGITAGGDINVRTAASAIVVSANTGIVDVSAFTGTVNIVRTDTGKEVIFRGFSQGGAANLYYSGNNIIVSSPRTTVVGGGAINVVYSNTGGNNQYRVSAAPALISATTVGTGTSLLAGVLNRQLQVRSISGGGNVDVSLVGDTVVISSRSTQSTVFNYGIADTDIPYNSYADTQLSIFAFVPSYEVMKLIWSGFYAPYPETRAQYAVGPLTLSPPEEAIYGFQVKRMRSFAHGFFVVTEHGELYGAGLNRYGDLGIGDTVERKELTYLSNSLNININNVWQSAVVNNNRASTFVLGTAIDTNVLYAAGNNNNGQLGQGDTLDRNTWVPVKETGGGQLTRIGGFSSNPGFRTSCIVYKEPQVPGGNYYAIYTWGDNNNGCLGHGDNVDRTYATRVTTIASAHLFTRPKVYMFGIGGSTSWQFSFVVTGDGHLFFAGRNNGQAGIGNTTNYNVFVTATPTNFYVLDVWGAGSNGENHAWVFGQDLTDNTYKFLGAGQNNQGTLGIGHSNNVTVWTPTSGLPVFTSAGAVKFAYSVGIRTRSSFLVVTATDDVYACGYRANSYIDGTNTNSQYFKKVPVPRLKGTITNAFGLSYTSALSVNYYHCLVTDLNEVVVFGYSDEVGSGLQPTKYIIDPFNA